MIENYIIKHENNEDILYLYLNYNYEFGSFNKGKPFFKELKDILNNKYINFKGNKIVLIVSGIVIGTIFLNIDYKKYDNINLDNYNYVNQVVLNDFNDNEEYVINVDESINNIVDNSEIDNKNEEIISNNTNINTENIITNSTNNTSNNNEEKIITNNSNINIKTEENINNNIKSNDIVYIEKEEQINNNIIENNNIQEENNKIMVTVYRNNGSILDIELEEYLIGVVAGEMPASFNIEALKTQAIIARTYALKSIERNKLLTDTVSTQVYIDEAEMHNKWGKDFDKYYNKIKEAVNSTNGLCIKYQGSYIDAVYFASSNGYTEDAYYVWGNNIPYLKSVESSWDINSTKYKYTTFISFIDISNKLGIDINKDIEIYNILRNDSHRITSITFNNKTFTGVNLRRLLGLKSADFDIIIKEDGLEFTTYGYGHGVGVSQYGANGMANNGYSYEDIIKYYYKGVNIEKIIN